MLHEKNMFYKCHVIKKDNGTIYIVIGVWLETHIKRHVLFFFFFFFECFFFFAIHVLRFIFSKIIFKSKQWIMAPLRSKVGDPVKMFVKNVA